MLGPHGGRGGQKRPKNGPHGLCMTPYVDDFFLVLHCIWLALSLSTFKFVENSFTLRIATFGNKNVCNDRYVC